MRSLAVFLAVLLFASRSALAAPQSIDRIIAVVNDSVILQSDLDQQIAMTENQMRDRGIAPPPLDALRSQVLEHLILVNLQTQRANDDGIRVDDSELNSVLGKIAAQNHMNLTEFADQLHSDGIGFPAFREQIRNQMLIQRVRQKEVDGHVMVTDQDVNLQLSNSAAADDTEYHLAHILVALPEGAGPQDRDKARAKAQALLKRARDGEDFAQLAIANSDGQQALQGGDLDWRKVDRLPTVFAGAVPKLAVNQVSDIIETASGFNILKLLGKRSSEPAKIVTETHAEHILLKPNEVRDEDATRVQAFDLYKRLKDGADFAALAKQFSDDPGSKNSGGDLEWQPPGVFDPAFQEQLDQLQPGETSEPFHTQFGWHIARVLARRTRDATQETQRNHIREAIFERKETEQYDDWLRRLRGEAYVEIRAGDATPAATPAS